MDEFCRTPARHLRDRRLRKASKRFADDAPIRLKSVQNATDQAMVVAKMITGRAEPYASVPWFWSNQYDIRLQTIGLSRDHDQAIVRGDPPPGSSRSSTWSGQVLALDCVNATKDYVEGKGLVTGRVSASPEMLADTAITLKSLQTLPSQRRPRRTTRSLPYVQTDGHQA